MNWHRIKDRFIYSIQRFFAGRNGADLLSIAVFSLGFAAAVAARIFQIPYLVWLYYLCAIYFFYRTLSKNVWKRQQENAWFRSKLNKIRSAFHLRQTMFRERKVYKYLKCPKCRQGLRVPRDRGKIEISCKKCGNSFIKKV